VNPDGNTSRKIIEDVALVSTDGVRNFLRPCDPCASLLGGMGSRARTRQKLPLAPVPSMARASYSPTTRFHRVRGVMRRAESGEQQERVGREVEGEPGEESREWEAGSSKCRRRFAHGSVCAPGWWVGPTGWLEQAPDWVWVHSVYIMHPGA
jgi:hypothetical protein